jgi:hypothetical protein
MTIRIKLVDDALVRGRKRVNIIWTSNKLIKLQTHIIGSLDDLLCSNEGNHALVDLCLRQLRHLDNLGDL